MGISVIFHTELIMVFATNITILHELINVERRGERRKRERKFFRW